MFLAEHRKLENISFERGVYGFPTLLNLLLFFLSMVTRRISMESTTRGFTHKEKMVLLRAVY